MQIETTLAELLSICRTILMELRIMSVTTAQAETDMTAALTNLGTAVAAGIQEIQNEASALAAEATAAGVPASQVENYVANINAQAAAITGAVTSAAPSAAQPAPVVTNPGT
jgi:hypothetical protein